MKFAQGLLGGICALGIYEGAKAIIKAVKREKYFKEYNKAYENFLDFKDDKKLIEFNGGLEGIYNGPGIVRAVKSKDIFTQFDLSKYENEGDPIGITFGDNQIKREEQYIIPEVEVYKFANGHFSYRFDQEKGVISPC